MGKAIIIILIIVVVLFLLGIGLYVWSRNKSIHNIKANLRTILKLVVKQDENCNIDKYIDCYVNAMIKEYGLVQVIEFNNAGWRFDNKEQNDFSVEVAKKCSSEYCKSMF